MLLRLLLDLLLQISKPQSRFVSRTSCILSLYVVSFDQWLNSEHHNGFKTRLQIEIQASSLNEEIATDRIDAVKIVDFQRFPPKNTNREVHLGFLQKVGNEMKISFWGVASGVLRILQPDSKNVGVIQFVYLTQSTMEMVCAQF